MYRWFSGAGYGPIAKTVRPSAACSSGSLISSSVTHSRTAAYSRWRRRARWTDNAVA